jgi:hypothetical protein
VQSSMKEWTGVIRHRSTKKTPSWWSKGDAPIREALRVYPKLQGPNSLWLGTRGLRGVTAQVFHYRNKYTHTYIYIKVYFTTILRGKTKKKAEERWGGRLEVTGAVAVPNSAPRTSTRGQRLLQAFQDQIDHRQDFPS